MELTAAVVILVSVVAPFVIAWIVRPDWAPDKKRNVAIIVSVVLGVIVAVATGQITQIPATVMSWVQQILIGVGAVVALAQGYYKALKDPVDKFEGITSPAPLHSAGEAPPDEGI